jgi:hypothetical protein
MGAPADHSDNLVKAVHPWSRGPRPRPGPRALGTRTGRGPIDCDPARPDRSQKPQPAGRLINVNTATTAERKALRGIGQKRREEIRPLVTAE